MASASGVAGPGASGPPTQTQHQDMPVVAQEVPEANPPLFPLSQLLRDICPDEAIPRIHVVDIGAMILSEAEDVWKPLVRKSLCASVVGFEPCAEECDRLNASTASSSSAAAAPTYRWLPWALGDGSVGEFRLCSAPMTSSMLEPNIPLLRRFVQLEEVTTVAKRIEMQTRRLDDLQAELPGGAAEFLKLDVQGYELAVLQGASESLKKVLVIHTEVEFVEMYKDQPLFAEVDRCLRERGFVFHRFASIHGRPMKPIHLLQNPLQPISQQMWADAVYVRDLWELRDHSRDELLKTALILHELYKSYDVVHHVLQKVDEVVAKRYLDTVLATR
mmetsp:Transcript_58502/g.161856  ORF Transcript_58502/g.161856 Transcript_58502/m.161856 type:complete len:332 (-) Transcript_58502:238-1233(-)